VWILDLEGGIDCSVEVQSVCQEALQDYRGVSRRAIEAPALTFKEAAERWLAVEGGGLKTNTLDTYGNILELHILPHFGFRPITEITGGEVEDWWGGIQAKNSPGSTQATSAPCS
jgi:hypothetical protein